MKSFLERLDFILSSEDIPGMWEELGWRLAKQLLFLGDENSARIAFEQFIGPVSSLHYCEQCFGNSMPLYYCKTCILASFCSSCLENRKDDKMPWCRGHEYLKVPGDDWKNLPDGVVNMEGQSFLEWLTSLKERYDRDETEGTLAIT
jgi:hypothetical protein